VLRPRGSLSRVTFDAPPTQSSRSLKPAKELRNGDHSSPIAEEAGPLIYMQELGPASAETE
jgi:hypothetical protein